MARFRFGLGTGISALSTGVAGMVFPSHCALCGTPHGRGQFPICSDCADDTELHGADVCLKCGCGHGIGVGMTSECVNCADQPEDWPFEMVVSAGPYEGRLRDAVLALKFGKHLALAQAIGSWLAQAVVSRGASIDAVVPIPLGWMRRVERGFNQSELIARQVATTMDVPCMSGVLKRRGFRPPQRGLSEAERRANPKGAFTRGRSSKQVKGKRILLVDDVLTTGATLREARKVLRRAGASAVLVAVVARTRGK